MIVLNQILDNISKNIIGANKPATAIATSDSTYSVFGRAGPVFAAGGVPPPKLLWTGQ